MIEEIRELLVKLSRITEDTLRLVKRVDIRINEVDSNPNLPFIRDREKEDNEDSETKG